MSAPYYKIKHILCPTDLSPRSQLTLSFASGIATRLSAKVTACHFSPTVWLTGGQHLDDKKEEIESRMAKTIKGHRNGSAPDFAACVFENSVDPAKEILQLAGELKVDLIVMKARRGVLSALHYGSIVERITRNSPAPVLLLPTTFLDSNSSLDDIDIKNVLFDYDFSDTTDRLFPAAMALTEGFKASLHLLAVLEPPEAESIEAPKLKQSCEKLQVATQNKLDQLVGHGRQSALDPHSEVVWGSHSESVLKYADDHNIDLICTTLPAAYYYFDKLYCAYLGQLLQSAKCPILALRSV